MSGNVKKIENLPLVITLIVVIIIAVVLTVFKDKNSEQVNANTKVSDTTKLEDEQEIQEEQQPEDMIFEENVQEIVDETEKEEEVEAKYFIRVNYGQNVVTIYTKDTKGEYTVPYKAMVCSTGTATPRSGTYTMPSGTYSRGVWGMMIGNVWAQYFTRIKGSILFHSVPYTERNKWSLEYWEYDKLGTAASAGCIRLTVQDAKWIYNNCAAGTKVEFYTDSNPGPLGKPTSQKISEDEEVRGWDPTDPDESNPWKTYEPKQDEEQEEITPNKPTTTTKPTKPNTPITPEEETPEQNQGDEVTTPNEGDESGENQEGGEQSGGETTPPDTGEEITPPEEEEQPEGEDNNQEENTGEDTSTETGEEQKEEPIPSEEDTTPQLELYKINNDENA